MSLLADYKRLIRECYEMLDSQNLDWYEPLIVKLDKVWPKLTEHDRQSVRELMWELYQERINR